MSTQAQWLTIKVYKPTYVLCGNYNEFSNFCWEELDMNHRTAERYHIRYLSEDVQLRGHFGIHIVTYGTWYSRRDLNRLTETITCMRQSGGLL